MAAEALPNSLAGTQPTYWRHRVEEQAELLWPTLRWDCSQKKRRGTGHDSMEICPAPLPLFVVTLLVESSEENKDGSNSLL